MRVTVGMIGALIDQFAPFASAESFDNVGLLVGRSDQPVDTVLVAMDVTSGVIEEAKRLHAQLIVTHHPLLFAPRRDLREEDREGQLLSALIRAEISLISVHTNFDKAPGGVNDALLAALSLPQGQGSGLIRTVTLTEPLTLTQLEQLVQARLGDTVRRFALPNDTSPVRCLSVCGGAGGDYWDEALREGADCYLTGECKLHHAREAVHRGMRVLEAGHEATERFGVAALCQALQNSTIAVQYSVRIVLSSCFPYE